MKHKTAVLSETRFLAESLFRICLRGRQMSPLFRGALIGMIEARLIRGRATPITAHLRAAIERLAFEPQVDAPKPVVPERPARYLFGPDRLRTVAAPAARAPSVGGSKRRAAGARAVHRKRPPHGRMNPCQPTPKSCRTCS